MGIPRADAIEGFRGQVGLRGVSLISFFLLLSGISEKTEAG